MNIPERMKALVAHGTGDYRLEDVPVPKPGRGEILLAVEGCGICAGDLKAAQGVARFWGGDGNPPYCEVPFTPGHEFFGRVAALGEDAPEGFAVGDRIVSEQIVPCGKCWYCRHGKHWLCDPHNVYGFKYHLNGGMAEYVRLPANAINYHIPESLTLRQAALVEPFACSLHGVRQSGATVDDVVVVAGAGTLGLGMIGALRRRNPRKLIALDRIDSRLELAKRFGADMALNPANCDLRKAIDEVTEGVGCDVYIEATGHPSAVQQGLDLIRKGGTFVEFSVMSGTSTVDWSIIGDAKEITIVGSQLSPYCFEPTIEGISSGAIPTDGVVTHVFPLSRWKEAFETAGSREAVKVVIVPDGRM